jgi:cell division protein FtsX
LKEDLKEHEEILAGIPENPLPSSIEIMVTDARYLEEIAFQLSQYSEIEEVNYGGELTKNLILLFDLFEELAWGLF